MSDNDSLGSVESSNSWDSSFIKEEVLEPCVKLKLSENIQAWLTNTELLRDEESVPCESKLAEKVVTNYIIAKRILSNVCWQEKLLCKRVCTTWWSAVNALARERLNPVDFVYDIHRPKLGKYEPFTKSNEFSNEPLAVLSFVKASGQRALKCKDISPCLCKPPCENTSHSVLDVIQQQVCSPKTCMLTVMTNYLMYLPLPNSPTEPYSPDNPNMPSTLYSGVSIPVIPGVKIHILNIKQKKKDTRRTRSMDLKKDFYDKVDSICQDQIIKGALVFVTEKYILQSVQDIMMLNYLSEMQQHTPHALGGCLIDETLYGDKEMDLLIDRINSGEDFVSKNLISIVLFTVPKNLDDSEQIEKCNFDMFSLVVDSSEWTKEKIKKAIDEFAKSVTRFEHSIALKLSCVGRDKKHMLEQELFRQAFPSTPVFGCYGNGELGLNHPPRAPPEPHRHKRLKGDPDTPGLMYSYSTVFVYMGWGKILPPDPETPKK